MTAQALPRAERRSVGIVLPPVWTHVFLPSGRLLQYAFEDLGWHAELVEYEGKLEHDLDVVLGWSLYREPFPSGRRYVLYQLEPLGLPLWQQRLAEKRFLFEQASAVWDYSTTNLAIAPDLGAHWLPLGYHPRLRDLSPEDGLPEYDAVFVGFLSPRRRALLERLSNHCLLSIQPRWGRDLLQALASTKLVLNIHQYDDPTPLEQPRVAYALNQGLFVLSEAAIDEPYPELPTAPYSQLIEQTLHYLEHPSLRHERQRAVFRAFGSRPMVQGLAQALAALEP